MESLSRRRLLQSASMVSFLGLSGCTSLSNSDSTSYSPEYDQLRNTAIYVADDVGLRLPENATRVDAPENAELLILHGNLAVTAQQVVTWLKEGRIIALLGDRAEDSWFDVTQSEPYRETFDSEGFGDAEPDPQLLIAAAIENRTTTYRKTWGDQPDNNELLAALDETMTDIETRRSKKTE